MRVYVCLAGLGVCLLLAGKLTIILASANQDGSNSAGVREEVTVRPHSTTPPSSDYQEDVVLPLCPPKVAVKEIQPLKNILLVSTLDGQLSALDLNKDGEMFWSVSTFPGSMLSSTISQMDLDTRGQYVKLIPSLSGRLYKFNGEMVEPIPMDVDSLLGSSMKMQENMVVTGGKESRTYGIMAETGEILYECSMNDCTNFQENTTKDIIVVQRNTQTVRAHTPRTGEQKWNFSVSLHDVSFHPSEDPCQDEGATQDDVVENKDDFVLKAVVPEGVICATRDENVDLIKWKRKFQSPIVDVWRLRNGELRKVDLFSKQHIPKRDILLDDDDDISDDENPSLYIGRHNNQLYIQESVKIRRESENAFHQQELDTDVNYPRVSWKPYLVSPSRTPIINHGSSQPDMALISFEQTIKRGDSKTTALTITANNGDYPFDAGFYLYPDTTPLDDDDPVKNITALIEKQGQNKSEDTAEFIYMSLWHWWKEVVFISLITAVMMNVLITRPIIHEIRDNFQQRSRELVQHVQNLQQENATKEIVREVLVEVPVPTMNNVPSTPSVGTTTGSSGPDYPQFSRENSNFSSRFLTDFEPLQCLGRGGFGVVFESKNKLDDSHYAVKRITLPSSEESKTKVMREVKLHAKLDHKNIVRYYSTWLETPPVGWQEEADAWFDEADLGTGPTPFDPTSTDYSMSLRGRKLNNPLKLLSGTQSGYTEVCSQGESVSFLNNCDNSFSIRFEDSHSFENFVGVENRSDCDGSDSDNACDIDDRYCDESTGGIMFSETKGEVEAVAVNIDDSLSRSESKESLSCCEALDWDENQNEEKGGRSSDNVVERKMKMKSYLYIVMELCRKETLRDWLRNNSVRRETEVLSFFYQICVGVEYVHQKGLIHRDLKPSNIYFSSHDGIIKIGDFGLVTGSALEPAVLAKENGDTPSPGSAIDNQLTDQVGTQLYMSPEQFAQKPYNHKVDIFSLGLIFLELLVPFSTQMERIRALSDAKRGRYPGEVARKIEYAELLGLMLNNKSDMRPEAEDILQLPWLQEYQEVSISRRRLDTTGSDSFNSSKDFNEELKSTPLLS